MSESAVQRLASCVDELLAVDCGVVDSAVLVESLALLQAQTGRLRQAQLVRVAELVGRRVPAELGFRGTAQFVQTGLRCTSRAARDLAVAVERFGPRRTLTGQPLPALFPVAAQALADGGIQAEHARLIAEAIQTLPGPVQAARGGEVEAALVGLARTRDPGSVRLLAARVLTQLDPDGPAPAQADSRRRSRRGLRLTKHGDGSAELAGYLSPGCAAIWESIFTPLTTKSHTAQLAAPATTATMNA